jgi:hypothetical protein
MYKKRLPNQAQRITSRLSTMPKQSTICRMSFDSEHMFAKKINKPNHTYFIAG